MSNIVECRECGAKLKHWLGDHLSEVHGISVDTYAARHPGAPVASDALLAARKKAEGNVRRAHPPAPSDLTVAFAGLDFPVHVGVPEEACLTMPPKYRVPTEGDLFIDVRHALVSVLKGRSTYIYGPAGVGKDALWRALSATTRRPALIKNVVPGTDIEPWFFSQGIGPEGTFWSEGQLVTAARDGYLLPNGERVPYIIVFSDMDRADRAQAEHFRALLESDNSRINGPEGKVYPVLPGTVFVATANTAGGGDERGMMVSANVQDQSLMDRFERIYQFHPMDWKDEVHICREKFPLLVERCPDIFDRMGRIVVIIRDAIAKQELYGELSHRGVCSILGHAEDLLSCASGTGVPDTLLAMGVRAWVDGLPDTDTREKAHDLMDPHLEGGTRKTGDTSHIGSGNLANL
jgi:hypothetical protein